MPRGRPRKYATPSAAAEAKRERNRQQYLRRQAPSQPQGPLPPQIIAYEPFLPGDTLQTTPANTGLRISPAAPAQSRYSRGREEEEDDNDDDRREIAQLQAAEREQNLELAEEDAAIA
jgi:hypothetical protein